MNTRESCASWLWASLAAAGVMLCGCASGRPELPLNTVEFKAPAIPDGAAPVFCWRGGRTGLATYWGDQDLFVDVSAHLPVAWKRGGDGFWRVRALSGEGKPVPFLGVVRRYISETGAELAVIVPELDLSRLGDGLYLAILPGVKKQGGKIHTIQPTAILYEIRNHVFKPFRVKVPLIPERESPVTPRPVIREVPAGTPVPL